MTNRIKHDLSPQGIGELMKAPIRATLSCLDFPYIRLQKETDDNGKDFYLGVLVLELGNEIIIEMAGANYFKESLAIIAYHQQMTTTPLLVDDEVELSVRYFCEHSQFAKSVNPLIEHGTGKEITLEMMTKTNREKADLFFAEKRIKEGKE